MIVQQLFVINTIFISYVLVVIFMDNLSSCLYLFTDSLKQLLTALPEHLLPEITELRIRKNKPFIIYIGRQPYFFSRFGKLINHCTDNCVVINEKEFEYIIENAFANSFHSNIGTMKNGYIVLNNGVRAGIASSAVYKEGSLYSVRDITSINIRIPAEHKNCSSVILSEIYSNPFPSVIVAGAAAMGKTTLIRDMASKLSSGYRGTYFKTTIIDEREEITTGFDVGVNTDVIKCFEKKKGIESAVRTLSPDIIFCDEIGSSDELDSIKFGFNCGSSFVVTVHAGSKADIERRTIIRQLIESEEFDYLILLKDYTNSYDIYNLTEAKIENSRKFNDNDIFCFSRHQAFGI